MDGEAKGQVGGLDASSEARKDWAKRSKDWVCPSCPDGKTNAEILAKWQDMCREKGVNVDNEGAPGEQQNSADRIPEGLKLDYRDELEKESKPGSEPTLATSRPGDSNGEVHQPITSGLNNSTPMVTSVTGNPPPAEAPGNPSRPTADIRPQVSLAPQHNRTQISTRNTPDQDDGPWLDRAIIGVICALAFVILRKVLFAPADI